jgi:cytochrome c oxidase subunit 3
MTTGSQAMRARAIERREVVPSSVLGMLLFIGAEVMFFAGLISAFTISRAGTPPGSWTLPAGLTLPASATAINTIALLASGVLTALAHRARGRGRRSAAPILLGACVLGAMFVLLQGREWAGLLAEGVTMQSSRLGAFFYLIIGAHAVHAVGALGALVLAWRQMRQERLTTGFWLGAQTFWYFVVGVWPIIYLRVYF